MSIQGGNKLHGKKMNGRQETRNIGEIREMKLYELEVWFKNYQLCTHLNI